MLYSNREINHGSLLFSLKDNGSDRQENSTVIIPKIIYCIWAGGKK